MSPYKRWLAVFLSASAGLLVVVMFALAESDDRQAVPEWTAKAKADLYSDPLPPAALARMGTLRFRHETYVNSVAYSPDGKRLASGAWSVIRLWDAATGEEVLSIDSPHRANGGVCFSPDGNIVATASSGCLQLWDSRTGKKLREQKYVRDSFSFSPDGKLVAGSSAEGYGPDYPYKLRVWEVATGKQHRSFDVDPSLVAFSPNGRLLVAGGGFVAKGPTKSLVLLDVKDGNKLATIEAPERWGATAVLFSPDGKLLFVNSGGWAIQVREVPSGKLVRELKGDTGGTNDSLAISPDGKILAVGRWLAGKPGRNGLLSLWDVAKGWETRRLPGNEAGHHAVAFSPNGRELASVGADVMVRRWDVATGEEILAANGHEATVYAVAFSPDGTTLASASSDHTIRLWDVLTGQERLKLPGHNKEAYVSSVAFSPDGKMLVSAAFYAYSGAVILWDAATGKELRRFEGHRYGASAVAFSPNGRMIASGGLGSLDGTVRIWDAGTGHELHKLSGHQDRIRSVAFSPDGRRLASGSGQRDGDTSHSRETHYIRLWDVATGKEVRKFLPREQADVSSLAFSPDGKILASVGRNSWKQNTPTVYLWNPETGQELSRFGGTDKAGYAKSVAFSPDGKTLAVGYRDHTIRFWDPGTGKELHSLRGHRSEVESVAFSPGGKSLASGSSDTTILIWDVSRIGK